MNACALSNESEPIARRTHDSPVHGGWWPGARITDGYGCRRGWWRNLWALGRTRWSTARRFAAIDWTTVRRVVFVCQGNICRSPYAEGRARLVGLGIPSASCGLRVREEAAHPRAIDQARLRGVDLDQHGPLAVDDFVWRCGDLAVAMELSQVKEIIERVQPQGQATLLGLWSSPRRPHLQDPYGLSDAYFASCFAIIDDAIERMGTRLVKGGCA